MDTSNNFGEILRHFRKENGLSQEGLGNELREKGEKYFNKSTISRWENGTRKPEIETIRDLGEILGIDSGMLLKAAGYSIELGSEHQSSDIDLVVLKKKEEHNQRLTAVANSLLGKDLRNVTRWVNSNGQVEYPLYKNKDIHEHPTRLSQDDLSGYLEQNLISAYHDYTEWFFKTCFLPHLYAEWPKELKNKDYYIMAEEQPYELIDTLRLLAERKTFKGTCPVCKDWE
jgi:transcriptional regulator with XRE-family HTH domain